MSKAQATERVKGNRKWWWRLIMAIAVIVVVGVIAVKYFSPPPIKRAKEESVKLLGGIDTDDRLGDVVFVHGLGGDARTTWQGDNPPFFWPEQLAEDLHNVAIWSIDYNAS